MFVVLLLAFLSCNCLATNVYVIEPSSHWRSAASKYSFIDELLMCYSVRCNFSKTVITVHSHESSYKVVNKEQRSAAFVAWVCDQLTVKARGLIVRREQVLLAALYCEWHGANRTWRRAGSRWAVSTVAGASCCWPLRPSSKHHVATART